MYAVRGFIELRRISENSCTASSPSETHLQPVTALNQITVGQFSFYG